MGNVPTIATVAAGAAATSAYANSIKAGYDFVAGPPRCVAYQNTVQNLTNATYAVISLDAEVYDIVQAVDAATPMHDNVTQNSRIYVRTPGKYEISAQILFDVNSTGSRSLQVRKNAAGSISGGTQLVVTNNGAIGTYATAVQLPVFEDSFAAGDYIEMFGQQNSGATLATIISGRSTFLRMKWSGA